jgi:hypothetical protein
VENEELIDSNEPNALAIYSSRGLNILFASRWGSIDEGLRPAAVFGARCLTVGGAISGHENEFDLTAAIGRIGWGRNVGCSSNTNLGL